MTDELLALIFEGMELRFRDTYDRDREEEKTNWRWEPSLRVVAAEYGVSAPTLLNALKTRGPEPGGKTYEVLAKERAREEDRLKKRCLK